MLKPSVEVSEEDGVLRAEFWDCLRLDPAPVQELRKAFEAHRRRGGGPNLVVDLLGVGFAGSSALGGFLALRKLGARVIFCNVEPTVLEVFRVSKLMPLFSFEPDRDAALALVRSGEDAPAAGKDDARPPSTDHVTPPTDRPRPAPHPPLRRPRGRSKDTDSGH